MLDLNLAFKPMFLHVSSLTGSLLIIDYKYLFGGIWFPHFNEKVNIIPRVSVPLLSRMAVGWERKDSSSSTVASPSQCHMQGPRQGIAPEPHRSSDPTGVHDNGLKEELEELGDS